MDEKKTALIISGMHRSGTSSIAGVVGMLGAILPQYLMPAHSQNPLGFFESDKVMKFNDRILSESGTYWSDWRAIKNEWRKNPNFPTYLSEASSILSEEFGSSTFIVLKDPRFAKILPFWNCVLEKMDFRACHIIPIRDPAEVAASLYKRDMLPKSLSKLVWLRHILDAEIYSRDLPRVFVFWADFLQDWEREVAKIADEFKFSWPRLTDHVRSDVGEFLSLELRHHHKSSIHRVDDAGNDNDYVTGVYAALNAFYKDPYSMKAIEVFDSIRQQYLKTEGIYGPVFADMDAADKRQKAELDQAKARAAALAARVGELESLLNATTGERDSARHQTSVLEESVADLQTKVSTVLERSQLAESELKRLRKLRTVRKVAAKRPGK